MVAYYESGANWFEVPYNWGNKDGVETWYYSSGKKEREVSYKNGVEEGTLKYWDHEGNRTNKTR